MSLDQTESQNKLSKFVTNLAKNPWFAITGFLVGVFGIYAWWDAKTEPDISVKVSDSRTIVLKQGESTELKVFHRGGEIHTDLSSAKIYVWNRGKGVVRGSDVLQPLRIWPENNAKIIEATIERVGREVSKISVNKSELEAGKLRLDWDILERGDGAIVRVLFLSESNIRFKTTGIFTGQREPTDLSREVESRDADKRFFDAHPWALWGITFIAFAGFAWMLRSLVSIAATTKPASFVKGLLVSSIISVLVVMVLLGYQAYVRFTLPNFYVG